MILSLKDKKIGSTAYILGSGPTIGFFEDQISNYDGIFIGINHIYDLPNIRKRLNYLFIEKPASLDSTPVEKIGLNLENTLNILDNNTIIFHCSSLQLKKDNCYAYREDMKKIFRELGSPSGSFSGVSCSAYHAFFFALYMGCKKIYLVGCDCSKEPKFYEVPRPSNYENVKNGWITIKEIVETHHPDVEVLNINPINLKDVFSSSYTINYN